MNEWYYACGGRQSGPVAFEQLIELARRGELDPVRDLVWTSSMKDWTPAGQVQGIFTANALAPAPSPVPPVDVVNPYAAPQSAWVEPVLVGGGALQEIVHGSEPLDPVECVKRGFELTKRQFGNILLVGVVYFGVIFGLNFAVAIIQGIFGAATTHSGQSSEQLRAVGGIISFVTQLGSQVFSIFLGLGLTRVALNFVSGNEVSVGQLFGEGRKMLRAIGASILFGLMVFVGFLLLVIPGIYLALRYGQYMVAIVDRDLGVMDALSYSSSITTNNRLNLFLLGLLSAVVMLAGLMACGFGIIFAGPVVWLAAIVAYRWMQYGRRAIMD